MYCDAILTVVAPILWSSGVQCTVLNWVRSGINAISAFVESTIITYIWLLHIVTDSCKRPATSEQESASGVRREGFDSTAAEQSTCTVVLASTRV